jgi:hypothetical protein
MLTRTVVLWIATISVGFGRRGQARCHRRPRDRQQDCATIPSSVSSGVSGLIYITAKTCRYSFRATAIGTSSKTRIGVLGRLTWNCCRTAGLRLADMICLCCWHTAWCRWGRAALSDREETYGET